MISRISWDANVSYSLSLFTLCAKFIIYFWPSSVCGRFAPAQKVLTNKRVENYVKYHDALLWFFGSDLFPELTIKFNLLQYLISLEKISSEYNNEILLY